MEYTRIVRQIADDLGLIDDAGRLLPLDSLAVVELTEALETATQIAIPTARMRQESFRTVDAIAEMLSDLAA